ncbi:MAG: P27 family phage terminase small subunit [Clostridiales bacterium]|nr:P27 family phage terminase small subunit [Clostridiales bacterium]
MAGNRNSGGRRTNSGRKAKPLSEKILEGKSNIKTIQFDVSSDVQGEEIPEPKEFLKAQQRQGEFIAVEIRQEVWEWLRKRKCDHLIPMLIIDQFAVTYARWIQAEEARSEFGPLSKHPTTGNAQLSPFIGIAQSESKAALNLWNEIYSIVRANCTDDFYNNPEDDVMERLLSMPRRNYGREV